MNSLKKLMGLVASWLICLSFFMFGFGTSALADMKIGNEPCIFEPNFIQCQAEITDGQFTVNQKTAVPGLITVRSAVLSLPEDESGKIQKIVITGPDGQVEFGCENIKVQNGTDLIKACGGPAVLKAGATIYQAAGNDFQPESNLPFSVRLSSNF